jgi:hypothetical protein
MLRKVEWLDVNETSLDQVGLCPQTPHSYSGVNKSFPRFLTGFSRIT